MKKLVKSSTKPVDVPPGKVFPEPTPEEWAKTLARRKYIQDRAQFLGIDIWTFDSGSSEKPDAAWIQYEKDKSVALAYILSEQEVPLDVQERLLKVKAERERLKSVSGH